MNLLQRWLFPLTILAFAGSSILFVSTVFTPGLRWIFLVLLALSYLFAPVRIGNNLTFYVMLSFYAFWNICTTYWSESYQLTLVKSLLYAAISLTFLLAGQTWSRNRGKSGCFDFLIPLTIVMIASSVFGYLFYPYAVYNGNFRGLVHNANMFGSFMAMLLPLVFFKLYTNWEIPRSKWLWIMIVVFVLLLLITSRSRAAIVSGLFCMAGGMTQLPRRAIAIILGSMLAVTTVTAIVQPRFVSMVYKRYIIKQAPDSSAAQTLLLSREQTWADSLEKALEGGIIGGGFGISIGEGTWETNLVNVGGYGREKGNSQLAVMEETGIVGLGLYSVMLLYLFAILISRIRRARDKQLKMALGIATGILFGFFLQSTLEATWTAPGAPESVYFWAMTGCALGLSAVGGNRASAREPEATLNQLPKGAEA